MATRSYPASVASDASIRPLSRHRSISDAVIASSRAKFRAPGASTVAFIPASITWMSNPQCRASTLMAAPIGPPGL